MKEKLEQVNEMGKSTRKICEIRIEQQIHWEEETKGTHIKVIDNIIALIDTDFERGQYTRKYNVQTFDKEKFLQELMKEIRGLL